MCVRQLDLSITTAHHEKRTREGTRFHNMMQLLAQTLIAISDCQQGAGIWWLMVKVTSTTWAPGNTSCLGLQAPADNSPAHNSCATGKGQSCAPGS